MKMKKLIKLTENDLHRIVRNSVTRIIKEANLRKRTNRRRGINEISGDMAQRAYDKMKRRGQFGGTDYARRASDLSDTYSDIHNGEQLQDNPTPEGFFHEICSTVERRHGIDLQSGWYVEATSYGDDEIYFYDSAEDTDEPSYTFSDNEGMNDDYGDPNFNGANESVVEMFYDYGKNCDFDVEETLAQFSRDMLG